MTEPDEEDHETLSVDAEGVRSDGVVVQRRDHRRRMLDLAEDLIADGYSHTESTDLLVEAFGCHPRTATRALAAMTNRWKDINHETIEERRNRTRARINSTRRRLIAAGKLEALNANDKNMMRLEGLDTASVKIEHSGTLGLRPVAALSPEERRAEIAALQAKQLAAGGAPAQETGDDPAAVPRKGRSRGN